MITSALARFNFKERWEQIEPVAEVIVQLAVRILFIVATTLMTSSACPKSLRDVVIPAVTLGSAFLSGFFYLGEEERREALSLSLSAIPEDEEKVPE